MTQKYVTVGLLRKLLPQNDNLLNAVVIHTYWEHLIIIVIRIVHEVHNEKASKHGITIRYKQKHNAKKEKNTQND